MTPESAYGRLNNLRDGLVDDAKDVDGEIVYDSADWADRIDDLDDIIKCIKRGMHTKPRDTCKVCFPNQPDSEDMEARKKHERSEDSKLALTEVR